MTSYLVNSVKCIRRLLNFSCSSKQDQINTQGLFIVNLRFFWEKACCPQNAVAQKKKKHVLKGDTEKQKQRESLSISLVADDEIKSKA